MAGFLAPIVGTALGTIALNLISNAIANRTTPKAPALPTRTGYQAVPGPYGYRWLNLATGKLKKPITPFPTMPKPGLANTLASGTKNITGALLGTAASMLPMAMLAGGTALGGTAAAAGPVANTGLKMALKAPGALMPVVPASKRERYGTVPGDMLRQIGSIADDTSGIGQGIQQGGMILGTGVGDLATQIQLMNIHRQLMGDTNSLGKQLKGLGLTPAELSYMEQIMRTLNPAGRPSIYSLGRMGGIF